MIYLVVLLAEFQFLIKMFDLNIGKQQMLF